MSTLSELRALCPPAAEAEEWVDKPDFDSPIRFEDDFGCVMYSRDYPVLTVVRTDGDGWCRNDAGGTVFVRACWEQSLDGTHRPRRSTDPGYGVAGSAATILSGDVAELIVAARAWLAKEAGSTRRLKAAARALDK